jgi:geranylgeranyl diphosphate synthase type I
VVDAGAALELLHTMAIVHDDVMDGSDRRRGMPAVHAEFVARHADHAWSGESRRFGEGVAILVGDFAFVYADMLLADAPPAARRVFDEMRLEVNVGQVLDLAGSVRRDATLETARTICQYKSGKYTVERPLHLGAALAGQLDALAPPLTAYGLPLGEAFQLRDDLLGAFGDAEATGKPVGGDVREGKPTALFALARARAAGADAELLSTRFGAPDLRDDEVDAILDLFVSTGARDEVECLVDRLLQQALSAAAALPLVEPARRELTALAHYVVGRST